MSARKLVTAVLLCLPMAVIGATSAVAQVTTSAGMYIQPQVFETTFAFQVGDKTLPAGTCRIEQPIPGLLMFSPAKGKGVTATVITRLAQPSVPLVASKIVFDKVGDKYYVSEIWLPEQDGFLVRGTKEAHTHHTIEGTTKK